MALTETTVPDGIEDHAAREPQAQDASQEARERGAYWTAQLAPFAVPSIRRSLGGLLTSVVPYLGLLVAMYFSLRVSYVLTLAIGVLASGFLLRTYIVFHDCSHGSYLPGKRANALARAVARPARLLAVCQLAPQPRRPPRDRRPTSTAAAGAMCRR